MMTSYLLSMTFYTNAIQVLQHRWKKYVNQKGGMLKNKPHLILWEYLNQPINFLAELRIYIYIYKIKILNYKLIICKYSVSFWYLFDTDKKVVFNSPI